MGRGRAARSRKPDSGHTGTISITIQVRRVGWNAMKPRIHCVLTHWNPGSTASGRRRQRTDLHDQHKLAGTTVLVVLM
jgi:hypothetical protein